MADSHLHALAELQASPTVELWHAELIRIYEGDRDAHIIQLGSAEEFVENILLFAQDRRSAFATFLTALQRAVDTWHPSAEFNVDGTRLWLQLIRRYTPTVGFTRVLELASVLRARGLNESSNLELFRTVLGSLESYFPSAPLDPEQLPAFHAYVKLLEACVDYEAVRGHASRRLLELGVLQPGEDSLMKMLAKSPRILNDLLASFLGPLHQTEPLNPMQSLYGACVYLEIEPQFEAAAKIYQAKLDHHQQGVTLKTPDGRRVELVTELFRERWTMGSFNRANSQGFKAFHKRVPRFES
jgi:hypothetical protein